jgi:hypothetical protein
MRHFRRNPSLLNLKFFLPRFVIMEPAHLPIQFTRNVPLAATLAFVPDDESKEVSFLILYVRFIVVETVPSMHHGEVVKEQHVSSLKIDVYCDFLGDEVQCIKSFVL